MGHRNNILFLNDYVSFLVLTNISTAHHHKKWRLIEWRQRSPFHLSVDDDDDDDDDTRNIYLRNEYL